MPKKFTLRQTKLEFYIFALCLLICGFAWLSYSFFQKIPMQRFEEPQEHHYRNDEMIFLRTFYLMKNGYGYYGAFKKAVAGDARNIVLTKDILTWRLPTIFYLWKGVAQNGNQIGLFFVALSLLALFLSERISAYFIPKPFSLLSPFFLAPYFFDAYFYQTSIFFIEWWGLIAFIVALALFLYDQKISWFFFLLGASIRELFFLPILFMAVFSLITRTKRLFFLSLLFCFSLFYIIHAHSVYSQLVVDSQTSIASRIKFFDLGIFQKTLAFSMRQYPLLSFHLPLIFFVIGFFSLIYHSIQMNAAGEKGKVAVLFSILPLTTVAPFLGVPDNDYWGIAFMPLLIIFLPCILPLVSKYMHSFKIYLGT